MYIGEIGKRMKTTATYKKSFEYMDYKYNYYGTTHYIHTFVDADGNVLVWKTTNPVEYINDDVYEFISEGSVVEITGTVKEHSEYKGIEQTILSRCKFSLIERAKTKEELEKEKAEQQIASLKEGDHIWADMPYRQYKEHYADCETVAGSFHYSNGTAYIDVIIRVGRLKASGVRGKHYKGWEFKNEETGGKRCYRAISEENARKRLMKEFPNSGNWELNKIYDYRENRTF